MNTAYFQLLYSDSRGSERTTSQNSEESQFLSPAFGMMPKKDSLKKEGRQKKELLKGFKGLQKLM